LAGFDLFNIYNSKYEHGVLYVCLFLLHHDILLRGRVLITLPGLLVH